MPKVERKFATNFLFIYTIYEFTKDRMKSEEKQVLKVYDCIKGAHEWNG